MKIMTRAIILVFLILQNPFFLSAQQEEIFELQADKVDSNTNSEIQEFYMKFNTWIASIGNDSTQIEMNKIAMVDDFIIFSEDGLMMKDLNFHSVESCKKQILENLPSEEIESKWIYVTLESHVNKSELIQILEFLKKHNIEYQFGNEGDFVPKIMKR